MTTLIVYQPHYGPQGQTYTVRARFASGMTEAHYWTEREAMDARDAAFDAGTKSVHVCGLPLRLASSTPSLHHPPVNVED
jgi:hypothetical protein